MRARRAEEARNEAQGRERGGCPGTRGLRNGGVSKAWRRTRWPERSARSADHSAPPVGFFPGGAHVLQPGIGHASFATACSVGQTVTYWSP